MHPSRRRCFVQLRPPPTTEAGDAPGGLVLRGREPARKPEGAAPTTRSPLPPLSKEELASLLTEPSSIPRVTTLPSPASARQLDGTSAGAQPPLARGGRVGDGHLGGRPLASTVPVYTGTPTRTAPSFSATPPRPQRGLATPPIFYAWTPMWTFGAIPSLSICCNMGGLMWPKGIPIIWRLLTPPAKIGTVSPDVRALRASITSSPTRQPNSALPTSSC